MLFPEGRLPKTVQRRTLDDVLHDDYFVSAHTKAAMGHRQLAGVGPVLLFFMARERARRLIEVQDNSRCP